MIGFIISVISLTSLTLAEDYQGIYSPLNKNLDVTVVNGEITSCEFSKLITQEICETKTIEKPREQWASWERTVYSLIGKKPYPITVTECRTIEIPIEDEEPPIIPPPINNTTNQTNQTQNISDLHYTVYTTSSAEETISTLKKHFVNPPSENYLFEDSDEREISKNFDHDFNFIIGSSTYQHILDVKFNQAREELDFDENDIINLDDEETLNVDIYNFYVGKSSEVVRGHGYKFGLTPSGDYTLKNYQTLDYSKIDWFGIQLQRFSNDKEKSYEWSKRISEYAKSKNPNIEIFVQVSLRQAETIFNLEETISEIAKIDTIDGYIITYMPDDHTNSPTHPCDSSICNGQNLDRVLDYIEGL